LSLDLEIDSEIDFDIDIEGWGTGWRGGRGRVDHAWSLVILRAVLAPIV
jgi:hypothetical protein